MRGKQERCGRTAQSGRTRRSAKSEAGRQARRQNLRTRRYRGDSRSGHPDPAAVIGPRPDGDEASGVNLRRRRTLGLASSIEGRELIRIRDAIASIEIESVDLDAARRQVAAASGEDERLKERVAALRGGVQSAPRGRGGDRKTLGDLESAAAELSAAQSEANRGRAGLNTLGSERPAPATTGNNTLELQDRLRNRRQDARRARS